MATKKVSKDIFSFVKEELLLAGITPKDLRKKKYFDLKREYAKRALNRYIETEYKGQSREQVLKEVRSGLKGTGVTFSNDFGRKSFNEIRLIQPQRQYATKLNKNKLPDDEYIPKIEYSIKEQYMYGFKIYLRERKSNKKGRNPPRNSNTEIVRSGKYTSIDDFVFISPLKMNKTTVLQVMNIFLSGQLDKLGTLQEYIEGSDFKGVIANRSSDIIAFRYDRLMRT